MSNRAVYADTVATIALTAGAILAVLNLPPVTARAALAGILVLFLPGYALTTLVFPATKETRLSVGDVPSAFAGNNTKHAGVPFLERVALSIGLSVALVPLFAWSLEVGGVEFLAPNVAAACGGFAIVAALLGGVRRLRIAAETRYVVPIGTVAAYRNAARDRSNWDNVLNVALVGAVVVATVVVTFALVSPASVASASYTQASLLTEADDGSLVASDYPQNLTVGESGELVLLVENYEQETTRYTVVAQLQRVESNGEVTATSEIDRFSETVETGDRWQLTHEVAPSIPGENLRLTYLIYKGDAPENPTIESSYRHVTLWMDVTEGGDSDAQNTVSSAESS
ncbi:DUF1616 domain-containing protein [Halogeometricum borinquense]|uniref:DUF1616 domain-containing protein n=1 Tax=Halogeometricum borinquense TaxID=60847 RepID=A0A6C0UER4_9EURY|nr:DUF1616 domain-containing protein [Halogeometricum borinquense]QIB73926.1 DUF1616 domain-containing protein [Halogeometricum borinquense]